MPLSRPDLLVIDPSEFVARRDALARELRAQGDKTAAAEIKKLRRPSVAVWALNLVARELGDVAQQLVDAADEARTAQRALLERADADANLFRTALSSRRRAMADVADAAGAVIDRSERSRDTYTRDIEDALNAIVASADLCARFRRSDLLDVPRPGVDALDTWAGIAVAGEPRAPKEAIRPRTPPRTALRTATATAPSARLIQARAEVDQRVRDLSIAERELEAAGHEVAAADANRAAAEANLVIVEQELEHATARHTRAQSARARLQEQLERSRELVESLE